MNWGLRDYGTGTWEGGEASCEHKGRPKPRQDTSGGGPDKGRFAASRGTQDSKAIHSILVLDVCRCGARRVDRLLYLERIRLLEAKARQAASVQITLVIAELAPLQTVVDGAQASMLAAVVEKAEAGVKALDPGAWDYTVS